MSEANASAPPRAWEIYSPAGHTFAAAERAALDAMIDATQEAMEKAALALPVGTCILLALCPPDGGSFAAAPPGQTEGDSPP